MLSYFKEYDSIGGGENISSMLNYTSVIYISGNCIFCGLSLLSLHPDG